MAYSTVAQSLFPEEPVSGADVVRERQVPPLTPPPAPAQQNLRAQLQVDDPSSPGNAMSQIGSGLLGVGRSLYDMYAGEQQRTLEAMQSPDPQVRAQAQWDLMLSNMGGAVVKGAGRPSMWHKIKETFTPEQNAAAKEAWNAAGRTGKPSHAQTRYLSMERAVPEDTQPVTPGTLTTPGQKRPDQLLGPTGEAAQQEMIRLKQFSPRALLRRDTRQLYQDVMSNAPAGADLRRMYTLGQEVERWYVHSYDELASLVKRFKKELPPVLAREIDLSSDPLVLARMVASTSVQKPPGPNTQMALDAFIDWLRKGKPEKYMSDIEGFMPAHLKNVQRATIGQPPGREPLSGQKVGSYGLNILGSEWNTTIDRWMVRVLLGRPTTAANLTKTDYQLASDRLVQLAQQFGTTPARVQAALWTGAKLVQDRRIYKMLRPEIAGDVVKAKGAGTGMLTIEQAVPALADTLRYWGDRVIAAGHLDPKLLTNPAISMATLLLALDQDKAGPAPAAPAGPGL